MGTREIFFFKNHSENEAGRLVPDPKSSGIKLSFNKFDSPQLIKKQTV